MCVTNPTALPNDPYLLLPPIYRNRAFLTAKEFMTLLAVGRPIFFQKLKDGELPSPAAIHKRDYRWATVVVAKFVEDLINPPASDKN